MFPDGLPREVIEKIDEIVRLIKNNKLAFFCGAGISVNGPSNLPTGNALVDEILDALEGAYPLSLEVRRKIKSIQFEAFVEMIEAISYSERKLSLLESIVNVFSKGKPNKNHYLIAHLMAKGYLTEVMTTNFDTKIEEAMHQLITLDHTKKKSLTFTLMRSSFLRFKMASTAHLAL